MNNTDGYSTPVTIATDGDVCPHGPLSPPPTPRYRKPTIGVKRMPSNLAIPTLDELEVCGMMTMNSTNDNDLPRNIHSLKPRTDLPTLSYRASFISTTTTNVVVEAVVGRSTKRQRKHHHPSRCSIRASLSPINSGVQTPRKSSRSDSSCDWWIQPCFFFCQQKEDRTFTLSSHFERVPRDSS